MTTINKYKPCLKYKPPFDKEEGKIVQLKNTANSKEEKIRLMTGSSAEEVLYTIKAFKNKAIDIDLPNNQRIKEFMNCLGSKARDRWAKLIKNRRSGDFANNQWNQAKKEWIAEYVKDKKAKETILNAWTSTKDFMKPKEVDIKDHSDQIETICNYIDRLPGDHAELTDMERKSLLFNTFPMTWCNEFTLNRNDPEQASEKKIKDFMEKRKDKKADKEDRAKERAQNKAKKIGDIKKKEKIKRAMNLAEDTMAHISGKTVQPIRRTEEEVKAEGPTTRTLDVALFKAQSSASIGTQEEVIMDQEALEAEAVNKEEDLAEEEECHRNNTISIIP